MSGNLGLYHRHWEYYGAWSRGPVEIICEECCCFLVSLVRFRLQTDILGWWWKSKFSTYRLDFVGLNLSHSWTSGVYGLIHKIRGTFLSAIFLPPPTHSLFLRGFLLFRDFPLPQIFFSQPHHGHHCTGVCLKGTSHRLRREIPATVSLLFTIWETHPCTVTSLYFDTLTQPIHFCLISASSSNFFLFWPEILFAISGRDGQSLLTVTVDLELSTILILGKWLKALGLWTPTCRVATGPSSLNFWHCFLRIRYDYGH